MTATIERSAEPPAANPIPTAPAPAPVPPRRIRKRRRRRIAAVVLLVPLLIVGWSYAGALTYPGSASASVRTVDWLRSHGAAGLVNRVEIWHYSHQEPPRHGTPTGPLPTAPTTAQTARADAAAADQAPLLRPAVAPAVKGEAAWTPGPADAAGNAAVSTTWFRPDPKHPTVVTGALFINQSASRLHLIAGTKEPGKRSWPGTAQIAAKDRSKTVAAFNAGFLMRDTGGGFYQDGHTAGTLRDGAASLVIDRNGTATLGAWGTDVTKTPTTYAVRQNLQLIVDNHKPVPGLVNNAKRLWGSRKSQLQYTWRSGLGIDRNGNLVYVAGDHLTLTMLADALTQAGSVRAMQLDIHTPMTTANIFKLGTDDPRNAPVKLLPTMSRPADRYIAPDQRDFFTVTLR